MRSITGAAGLGPSDVVLEVGPGLGDLTRQLVKLAGQVVAVEKDARLAATLYGRVGAGNLEVIDGDILRFDLTSMPAGYKVVANIPYYLTSNLIRVLSESTNPPALMALLVQKEVAERIAAAPGQMSLLSVSTQLYYLPSLGPAVKAQLFEPPPKVDSQLIILNRRPKPLFDDLDSKTYLRVVKAGFAGRRKMLRSSLAAGLHLSKTQADGLLAAAGISGGRRAQELSLNDWHALYKNYRKEHIVN